ncbi:hypothetical protein TREES_T100001837 [Tupaia chinensis]|uniref:Uncharacterized protein n=1 Tax=Tupaia chinensis TaxID=246437 RepID=L9KFF3_TUPCH|nr:hypothetical protein TREES_T100001837 [Tupaia chinensis]
MLLAEAGNEVGQQLLPPDSKYEVEGLPSSDILPYLCSADTWLGPQYSQGKTEPSSILCSGSGLSNDGYVVTGHWFRAQRPCRDSTSVLEDAAARHTSALAAVLSGSSRSGENALPLLKSKVAMTSSISGPGTEGTVLRKQKQGSRALGEASLRSGPAVWIATSCPWDLRPKVRNLVLASQGRQFCELEDTSRAERWRHQTSDPHTALLPPSLVNLLLHSLLCAVPREDVPPPQHWIDAISWLSLACYTKQCTNLSLTLSLQLEQTAE